VAQSNPCPEAAINILVVDDNLHYRQQLCRLIGTAAPSSCLYEAEDIAEAVRLTEKIHPQLALVDVVLRDEDGIKCVRRLRMVSPSTRIVLISAYPDREFRRIGLEAGAIAFLDKKDLDRAAVRQVLEDSLG
jgi:DNA-binding NarL/FixJ family response regulator